MRARDYKMHGMTPTGRSRSYTYYTTVRKVGTNHRTIPTAVIEKQIASLLRGISVDPQVLPKIRSLYRQHVAALKGPSLQERVSVLRERLDRLHIEEAAFPKTTRGRFKTTPARPTHENAVRLGGVFDSPTRWTIARTR